MSPTSEILCIGHRGAKGHAPENTLASVRKALELGVHCIEVDVYHVGGELVVIHDDNLARTTNGTGKVMKRSFEYIRSLDAGGGEQVPTLAEVCDLVKGVAGINIELKGPGTAAPVVEFLRQQAARGWNISQEVLVSSFDHDQLNDTRSMSNDILVGVLLSGNAKESLQRAKDLNAYSFHPSIKKVNAEMVKAAHAQGQRVFVYTVNKEADAKNMKAMGVDGVFTDYPERIPGELKRGMGWP